MVDCNQFESSFHAWRSGKITGAAMESMARHASECKDCSRFAGDTAALRRTLRSALRREPSAEFESGLAQRIREVERGRYAPTRQSHRATGWAALSAGLATGLAIGVAVILRTGTENRPLTSAPPTAVTIAETAPTVNPNPDTTKLGDTLKASSVPYELGRHSRVVSSDR